jgi:hypothetical protein
MKSTSIWIDTRQAKLVEWDGKKLSMRTFYSGVERKPKVEGETSKKSKRKIIGFDYQSSQQARFREEFKKYLQWIAEQVSDSDYLYLLGPAETKVLLGKVIKSGNKKSVILHVEACDELTDNQLTDKVLSLFRQRLKKKGPPSPKRRLPPQGRKIPYKPK